MDQLELPTVSRPRIGHNRPPEPIDPIADLSARLSANHAELVARFRDLEVGCARVPDPIDAEELAALATDFIAQCQLHVRSAEAAHKREKDVFLKGGRIVDGFFKRRCQGLNDALAPVIARVKRYRDGIAEAERQRHEAAVRAAAEEARQWESEAAAERAEAERLALEAESEDDRRRAAERFEIADAAAARAADAAERIPAPLEPTRIRGDYGATAYVSRSWSFEVVALDLVPRDYLSLDVQVVREAINKDKIRHIPGLRIFQTEALRVRRL